MGYDYDRCIEDIRYLSENFDEVCCQSIGLSVMKKPIYAVQIGTGSKKLFINCAHHGLEHLTSAFIMKFLKEYAQAISCGVEFFGCNARMLSKMVTLYVVPMVNPDGVDIAVNGIDITNPYHLKLISSVGLHSFNKVWQANARGVDLNHNYNAGWRVVKTRACPTKYAGPYSESEPETKAMAEYIRKNRFDMLIAFHSQGGEIYYDFDGMKAQNSMKVAEKMAKESGYVLSKPEGTACFGGCKDWFIKEFGKAGFTVELGHGKNPLPLSMIDEIYDENARLILAAMKELHKEA